MLPRVALRAAALRTAPSTSTPRAIPTAWSRNYAHFNKPPVPPKKPSSGSSINSAYQAPNKAGSQRLTDSIRGAKERPERTDREELEDADIKESGEFNTKATPEQNAAPKSQPGPDVANATAPKTSRTAQSNRMQEEFEGPKSAEENTAPSSQPKQAPQESSEAAQEAAPETPRKPLPDLRQGIPSTFAEEFLKDQKPREPESTEAERDTAKIAEEVASAREREQQQRAEEGEAAGEASAGGGGRQGGDLPRSAYETSTDRRRNRVMNWVYAWFALTGSAGALWLGRNWETEEEEKRYPDAPSGFHLGHFWARIKARINDSMGYYTEPTFPKLLPEMDPPAPYTLVLSLEDLMIHSEWTRQHGYRTAKRPGLDYFLRYLSQYYEIVMFTSLPMAQAEPVYRKLDPYHIIMWPLFREGTRYYKGEYIKVRHFHSNTFIL